MQLHSAAELYVGACRAAGFQAPKGVPTSNQELVVTDVSNKLIQMNNKNDTHYTH